MTEFTPVLSTLGGVCIGVAMAILLLTLGRIAGISGIAYGVISQSDPAELSWRIYFLVGMAAAGALADWLAPGYLAIEVARSLPVAILGGVLVGLGTRIGNGCTSGHGVAGMARLSRRSWVATAVFLATGMLTATVVRVAFGGSL